MKILLKKSLYMKILVPLDGSKNAEKALLQACDLVKNYQGSLTLLYVVEKAAAFNLLDRKEYHSIAKKFGDKVLKKTRKTAEKEGVDPKLVMKQGNVVDEIVKLAKKEKTNLIIVGNKGLGKAARFFLGSVSAKLANTSPCSILIVK